MTPWDVLCWVWSIEPQTCDNVVGQTLDFAHAARLLVLSIIIHSSSVYIEVRLFHHHFNVIEREIFAEHSLKNEIQLFRDYSLKNWEDVPRIYFQELGCAVQECSLKNGGEMIGKYSLKNGKMFEEGFLKSGSDAIERFISILWKVFTEQMRYRSSENIFECPPSFLWLTRPAAPREYSLRNVEGVSEERERNVQKVFFEEFYFRFLKINLQILFWLFEEHSSSVNLCAFLKNNFWRTKIFPGTILESGNDLKISFQSSFAIARSRWKWKKSFSLLTDVSEWKTILTYGNSKSSRWDFTLFEHPRWIAFLKGWSAINFGLSNVACSCAEVCSIQTMFPVYRGGGGAFLRERITVHL